MLTRAVRLVLSLAIIIVVASSTMIPVHADSLSPRELARLSRRLERARLLAHDDHLVRVCQPSFGGCLHEAVTDHAVADDQDAPGRAVFCHVRPQRDGRGTAAGRRPR